MDEAPQGSKTIRNGVPGLALSIASCKDALKKTTIRTTWKQDIIDRECMDASLITRIGV